MTSDWFIQMEVFVSIIRRGSKLFWLSSANQVRSPRFSNPYLHFLSRLSEIVMLPLLLVILQEIWRVPPSFVAYPPMGVYTNWSGTLLLPASSQRRRVMIARWRMLRLVRFHGASDRAVSFLSSARRTKFKTEFHHLWYQFVNYSDCLVLIIFSKKKNLSDISQSEVQNPNMLRRPWYEIGEKQILSFSQ